MFKTIKGKRVALLLASLCVVAVLGAVAVQKRCAAEGGND